MRKASFVATVVCLAFVSAARAADAKNIIRGDLFLSRPSGESTVDGLRLDPDQGFGLQVMYERLLRDSLGVTFGVGTVSYDIDLRTPIFRGLYADVKVVPLTAAVLYHPNPEGQAAFYVGGGPAYVMYENIHIEPGFGGGEIDGENDFTWFAEGGIDIRLDDTGKWRGNVDLRYTDTSVQDLDIKPINLGLGVSYRF